MYNVRMQFEWDKSKALSNQRKHKITFSDAATVFFDEHALLIPDPDHDEADDRFIILGMSRYGTELIVCHCYRERDGKEVIRIISARKATTQETNQYWDKR